MHGFAFQVDKLVAEIEDHQLLHELSLEDDLDTEKLPSELNLSAVSSDSSMSGVALLPPDPTQDNSSQESGVAQLPLDELDCGVLKNIPVPSACSMPVHPSASPTPGVSHAKAVVSAAVRSSFPVLHSDTSFSLESSIMEQEQPSSAKADIQEQEGLDVAGPDSQMVESAALQDALTASSLVTTKAVVHSSPGGVTSSLPATSSDVLNLPWTPQCIPPTHLWEAAPSNALGAAGWSEDPALTVQESVVEGSSSHLLGSTSAVPGALSAQEGSNHAPGDGMIVSSKAAHSPSPVPSESSDLKWEPTEEDSESGHSSSPELTDECTHPTSLPGRTNAPASGSSHLSTLACPASSSLLAQDLRLSPSPPPPAGHQWDSLHRFSTCSSSSERPTDSPDTAGKLAPVDSDLPGSGWLSPEPPNPSVSIAKPETPPPPPFTSSPPPDHAEPSKDSSAQLQVKEECLEEVLDVEGDADQSATLDVTLESGAQVPMDRAVIEQLHAKAAKEVALWEDCLGHMTVNEHPHCEYPHIYGVRCEMEYYIKMEVPEQMAHYDEFHNRLLQKDMTAPVVEQMDKFVVCHIVACLLRSEYSLLADLLPSLEYSLCTHHHAIVAHRDELRESICRMDQKLLQISLVEAATPTQTVASGSIVPPWRDSDSSGQSEETGQPSSSVVASEEVERMLPPGLIKLEDQLHLAFVDHSAPTCEDCPWEHPHLRFSFFRVPRQFSESGLRIPIWFQGSEQLGEEALQIPISEKIPVSLIQMALLHQCDEASKAIWRNVQEIRELEWFIAHTRTACFRAGAGDLQLGLLAAGISPFDLQFPSVPQETQEAGCQAEPTTQSTGTQDGTGVKFIDRHLMDSDLHYMSTEIMDEYLKESGYGPCQGGNVLSHPFYEGPCVLGAVGDHFKSVSLIMLRSTLDSEIQALRDLDHEMFSSRPFRGVHVLAYTDDTYLVVLPTCSKRTIITEQLSQTMLELAKPLPKKDCLLSRSEYVKARSAAADPAPKRPAHRMLRTASTASGTVETASTAEETRPLQAARGGQETDSHTEVEAAPKEPSPSPRVFRPLKVAPQTDISQTAVKPVLGPVPTKAQRKMPPPNLGVAIQLSSSPQQSCTESFDLGGDQVPPPEDLDRTLEGVELDNQTPQNISATVLVAISATVSKPPSSSDAQCTEGTTAVKVIMASTSKPRLPMPALTEDGCVLPPCTVRSFPAPHPEWKMQLGAKELADMLPKSLPIVPGVVVNRSTALLELEFPWFIPKGQLSDTQVHLQTATRIQKALRTTLIHPAVEQSLLPTPTPDHHLGLVTVEDLRCLTQDDHATLSKNRVEFFFPILREHLVGGSTKSQQYLLSCRVFGWYPSHFQQKKLGKETHEHLTLLSDRIEKYDGGSTTFQASKLLTMCPFPDCLYMCSSQYAVVKNAMRQHYHTWVVCGACLCHFAPNIFTNI